MDCDESFDGRAGCEWGLIIDFGENQCSHVLQNAHRTEYIFVYLL